MTEGLNDVVIKAIDRAGSYDEYINTTFYDTGIPEIISTNLPNFQGLTFDRDITIRGNVTEDVTINIYVNGGSSPDATTDPNVWEFEVDVTLNRDVDHEVTSNPPALNSTITFKSGTSWENEITIEAVDIVNNKGYYNYTIIYALCSFGGHFYIQDTPTIPTVLTPRLIIMGIEEIGKGINITWQGSTAYNATITDIRLVQQPVNVEEQDDWDLGWVSGISLLENSNKTQAYGRIKIKAIDPSDGENWPWFEKEENLSDHRKGECETMPDDVGCFRIPLMFEIDFFYLFCGIGILNGSIRVSQKGNIMFFLEIHSYDHKIMKKRNPGVQSLNLGLKRHARSGILILWITRSSKNLFGLEVRRKT